jgi:hypothetical protein
MRRAGTLSREVGLHCRPMPTEDPEIRRAIEILEEVVALRGRSGAAVDAKLVQARAALGALGVDPDVVTDILYPPSAPEPADPAHLARLLRQRLDDLGYTPEDLQPPDLPELSREELDRRIEQAVREAAARAGRDGGGLEPGR